MISQSLICLFLVSLFAVCQPRCTEGEEQQSGSFVFKCRNGRLVPHACIMDDGRRILVGETSKQNDFVMACKQGEGNRIETRIVGCVDDNGREVQGGATFQWSGGQYKCIVDPNGSARIDPVRF